MNLYMKKLSFLILLALSIVSCNRKKLVFSTIVSSYYKEYAYNRYSNGEIDVLLDDGICISAFADTIYVLGGVKYGQPFLCEHTIRNDDDILLFAADTKDGVIVFNELGEQIINNPLLKRINFYLWSIGSYLYATDYNNTCAIYDVYGKEIVPLGKYRQVVLCDTGFETNPDLWDNENGIPKGNKEYYYSVKDTLDQVGLLGLNCNTLLEPSRIWKHARPIYVYDGQKNNIVAYQVGDNREYGVANLRGDIILPLRFEWVCGPGSRMHDNTVWMDFGADIYSPFWRVNLSDGYQMLYNNDGKVIVPPLKCDYLYVIGNKECIRYCGGYDNSKYWIEAGSYPDEYGNGAMQRYYELDGTLISDCNIYKRFSHDSDETYLDVAYRDGNYYVVEFDKKYYYVVKEHKLPRPSYSSGSWNGVYQDAWSNSPNNNFGGAVSTGPYGETSRSHEHTGNTYGYKSCHICQGTGICPTCNGKGWYYAFGNQVLCPNCDSNHNGVCSHCHGAKQVHGLIY